MLGDTLAERIVAAKLAHNCPVADGPDLFNIDYIAGVDPSGAKNRNRTNAFDDLRTVVSVIGDKIELLGAWKATIETGKRYTEHPINPRGAARIAFGTYEAWQVGLHRGNHLALVQTGGAVSVYRDANMDYNRAGDALQTGFFGINQHGGYDLPDDDIGPASAGCLVGNSMDGHRAFMKMIKRDARYLKDDEHVFESTIMPYEWLGIEPAPSAEEVFISDPAAWQAALNIVLKLKPPLMVDGIAGPLTKVALKKFQKTRNLDVDGIAGPKTLHELFTIKP